MAELSGLSFSCRSGFWCVPTTSVWLHELIIFSGPSLPTRCPPAASPRPGYWERLEDSWVATHRIRSGCQRPPAALKRFKRLRSITGTARRLAEGTSTPRCKGISSPPAGLSECGAALIVRHMDAVLSCPQSAVPLVSPDNTRRKFPDPMSTAATFLWPSHCLGQGP